MVRLEEKFCLSAQIISQVFCFLQKILKGKLPLAYESYAGKFLLLFLLKFLGLLFHLVLPGNNEAFRVTSSTSSWYYRYSVSGPQHWQQCLCFRFSFFFYSICFSVYQSVSLFVHLLFRINLKFLKPHNYWLFQLLYGSLAPELEWKTCRMHLKMLRNFSKKSWERH